MEKINNSIYNALSFLESDRNASYMILALIIYSIYGVPRLPSYIVDYFGNWIFKLMVLLLIVYIYRRSPIVSLFLSISFIMSLHRYESYELQMELNEAIENIMKPLMDSTNSDVTIEENVSKIMLIKDQLEKKYNRRLTSHELRKICSGVNRQGLGPTEVPYDMTYNMSYDDIPTTDIPMDINEFTELISGQIQPEHQHKIQEIDGTIVGFNEEDDGVYALV